MSVWVSLRYLYDLVQILRYRFGSSAGYQYQGISGILGQVKSGQVESGQVQIGQVESGQDESGQDKAGNIVGLKFLDPTFC